MYCGYLEAQWCYWQLWRRASSILSYASQPQLPQQLLPASCSAWPPSASLCLSAVSLHCTRLLSALQTPTKRLMHGIIRRKQQDSHLFSYPNFQDTVHTPGGRVLKVRTSVQHFSTSFLHIFPYIEKKKTAASNPVCCIVKNVYIFVRFQITVQDYCSPVI